MGQGFQVVAPRIGEFLDSRGKLGEILFDGTAADLVYLLAVFILPASLVQTGPSSTKLSDDNPRRSQEPTNPNDATTKRAAESEASSDAEQQPRHKRAGLEEGSKATGPCRALPTLSSLPVEIHQRIFDYLDGDLQDVICFAITNQYFWSIGQDFMHRLYATKVETWAGKNIVCIGEDVKSGDYPPGLHTRLRIRLRGGRA